jgi:hypothetical protein
MELLGFKLTFYVLGVILLLVSVLSYVKPQMIPMSIPAKIVTGILGIFLMVLPASGL